MGLNDTDRATLVKMYWERSCSILAEVDVAIANACWYAAANRIILSSRIVVQKMS